MPMFTSIDNSNTRVAQMYRHTIQRIKLKIFHTCTSQRATTKTMSSNGTESASKWTNFVKRS